MSVHGTRSTGALNSSSSSSGSGIPSGTATPGVPTQAAPGVPNAPGVPIDRWHAMTRLDEDRARSLIAQQASAVNAGATKKQFHPRDVKKMTIWGNHSSTLYPDFGHATIAGRAVTETISDRNWLETHFIQQVQQRGAAIIAARGLSSALSAANAAIETVRSLCELTPADNWHSVGICSDGSYGVDSGLISSFPTRSDTKQLSIIKGLEITPFAQKKIELTIQELREEKAMVADLIPK